MVRVLLPLSCLISILLMTQKSDKRCMLI
ncbi:hypothetical protein ACVXZ0_05570 [Staphylococcus aureus]